MRQKTCAPGADRASLSSSCCAVEGEQPQPGVIGERDVLFLFDRVAKGQPIRGDAVVEAQLDFAAARDIEIGALALEHGVDLSANASSGGTPTGSGSIALNATIATDGNNATGGAISIGTSGGTGTLALGANLLTQGGAITISAPTVVSASISIDSTDNFAYPIGAPVTFDSTVNDLTANSDTLAVTSGDNTITFNGAVGGSKPLGFLQLSGGGNGGTVTTGLDIEAPMTLGGGASIVVNQNVVIDAPITKSSGSGNLDIDAGDSDAANQTPRPDEIIFGVSGAINFAGSSGNITINYHPSTFPFDDMNFAAVTAGSGGFNHYMTINSAADLEAINSNLAGDYSMGNSTIDLSSIANWTPLGTFTGILNGETGVIANLTINSSASNVGLFSQIGTGGAVENLGLTNVNVTATAPSSFNTGALAGTNEGTITNVGVISGSVAGTNTSDGAIGGLVGNSFGTITDSYSSASVSLSSSSAIESFAGGLVGYTETGAMISQSYANGPVAITATGAANVASYAGGLVGVAYGNVASSYAAGAVTNNVTNTSQDSVFAVTGGLVADLNGSVTNSYASGAVSGPSNVGTIPPSSVGGLVGLVGVNGESGSVSGDSYWDTVTTTQGTRGVGLIEAGGTFSGQGLTTTQFAT